MEMKKVLKYAMEIGECMLVSGAGVSRVEDTISRICKAYGAKEANVFSITSSIVTQRKPLCYDHTRISCKIHVLFTFLRDEKKINAINHQSYVSKQPPMHLHQYDMQHLKITDLAGIPFLEILPSVLLSI